MGASNMQESGVEREYEQISKAQLNFSGPGSEKFMNRNSMNCKSQGDLDSPLMGNQCLKLGLEMPDMGRTKGIWGMQSAAKGGARQTLAAEKWKETAMSKHLHTRHVEERSEIHQFAPEKTLQKNFLAPQIPMSRNKLLFNLKKLQNRSVFHPDSDFFGLTRNPTPIKRSKS
jgi:hypothetical protein